MDLVVGGGGGVTVSSGGTIDGAIVDDGTIELLPGVALSGLTLGGSGFGVLAVDAGASFGSSIDDTGAVFLQSGFTGSGLHFSGGGTVFVASGATDDAATLDRFTQVVSGAASGTLVENGSFEEVDSGGISLSAILTGSGSEQDAAGGVASGTVVNSGATTSAYNGGSFVASIVSSGGAQEVDTGGAAIGAVLSGGAQTIYGGTASGTVIDNGGTQTVYAGGVASGTALSGGTGIIDGGRLDLAASLATPDAGSIVFSGGGVLEIDGTVAPTATISGFGTTGKAIDLTGIGGRLASASYSVGANGRVTFSGGTSAMTLTLDDALPGAYLIGDDGQGGLLITVAPPPPPAIALAPVSDSGAVGDGVTNVTIPTITGSGIPGNTITLYDGAAPVGSATVGATGTWSATPAALLGDGLHTLTATQTSPGGDVSQASPVLGLTIDTATPAPPSTPALAPGSDSGTTGDAITNVATPAITGSGSAGDTVTLYDHGTPVGSATVQPTGAWSIVPLAALGDGVHSLTATQTSPAGNASAASAPLGLTIDTAIPGQPAQPVLAPASDSGASGDDLTNIARPTITGSGVAGDTITLYDGARTVGSGLVGANGDWSITPAAPLSDGAHSLTVKQSSPAGNVSQASAALRLTIDTAPPMTPSLPVLAPGSDSGAPGDDITSITTPAIIGTGAAGDAVTLYDRELPLGSATVRPDGTWSITPDELLGDGLHSMTVKATDPAGNSSAASAALELRIDSSVPATPPAPQLASASDSGGLGDGITNVARPAIVGIGTAGDTILLFEGNASVGSGIVGPDGVWSITPAAALMDGTHRLIARAVNAAGTPSNWSPALALTIDTIAPAAPTLAPTDMATAPAEPAVAGTAPAGSTVLLYEGNTSVGAAVAGPAGQWQFGFASAFRLGTHVLTARAMDAAGNLSGLTSPLTIAVASDQSYWVAASADHAGQIVTRYYNAAGQFFQTDTRDSQGRLLHAVGSTIATLEIYDSGGTLIGTVTQPSSSAAAQPTFDTSGQLSAATTSSGPAGSRIDLFSENHVVSSQGSDTINAGAGNDTIYASGPTVSITGGSGRIELVAGSTVATLTGGSGSAVVFGGSGGGYLQGGRGGGNVLAAGSGNTTLVGGGAGDVLVAGTGRTTIVMQPGGVAFGNTGQTEFHNAADGLLVGGSGAAVMIANEGAETMFAGSGDTTMVGGAGRAILAGSDRGRTTMTGGTGDTDFVGYGGQVTATGGGGNDTFFTGTGTMQIKEGPGYDQVVFGTGAASVTGGSGVDHYVFVQGAAGASDVISGFKVGTDQLNLYGYDLARVQTNVSGRDTALSLPDGTRITLVGVTRLDGTSIA